jgi:CTP:molybdopterin cytidylyltransferase MocA
MGVERRAPVVILAAGESSRAGEPKGLVSVDGAPWIERQLAALAVARLERAVIVLGHSLDAYRDALAWLGPALDRAEAVCGLTVSAVVNPRPELGPFSSLRCALARTTGAAFVLPVDVPCAGEAVFLALEAAVGHGASAAVPLFASRGGHPVLLSRDLARDIAAIPDESVDARLDVQLRARGDRVARVAVDDPRVAMNLNTRDDFDAYARSG